MYTEIEFYREMEAKTLAKSFHWGDILRRKFKKGTETNQEGIGVRLEACVWREGLLL